MKKSTRALFRLHGWRGLLDFLHGYFYGRWPNRYISVIAAPRKSGRPRPAKPPSAARGGARDLGRFSRWFEERYHAKVLRLEEARKIVRLDRPVTVEHPERVVPFAEANRIVLDAPGTLAVMRCPCRETKGEEGCSPTEVCMVIGSPFVEFLVEHGTNGARAVTREEASDILRRTEELGWIHTAWFKDAMGGRFYAICNCCSCCCAAMRVMRKSGFTARYILPSGYAARVDEAACLACGNCRQACPFGAIALDGVAAVRQEYCFGCGVCRTFCGNGAMDLVPAPQKGVPMDVDALSVPGAWQAPEKN